MKKKKLIQHLANLEEQNRYLMGMVNKLYDEVTQVKANVLALHIEAATGVTAKRIPKSYAVNTN